MHPRTLIGFLVALPLAVSCSSGPATSSKDTPEWASGPTRTVDRGYIIYVGTGEDQAPERARFKAESMALQDLSNECTFAPKGARIEDYFDDTVGIVHRSRAKVAVEFQ